MSLSGFLTCRLYLVVIDDLCVFAMNLIGISAFVDAGWSVSGKTWTPGWVTEWRNYTQRWVHGLIIANWDYRSVFYFFCECALDYLGPWQYSPLGRIQTLSPTSSGGKSLLFLSLFLLEMFWQSLRALATWTGSTACGSKRRLFMSRDHRACSTTHLPLFRGHIHILKRRIAILKQSFKWVFCGLL